MSIYGLKKILVVGKRTDLLGFLESFNDAGIDVVHEESVKAAISAAQEEHPDAILFVLPRYVTEITGFVEKLREIPDFEKTPVVYVGALIEGTDQQILKERGVHTLTLGPVPVKEMARYVMKELSQMRF